MDKKTKKQIEDKLVTARAKDNKKKKETTELNKGLSKESSKALVAADQPELSEEEVQLQQESAAVLMYALADEAMSWKESVPENYEPAILAILYGGVQIDVHTLSQVSYHGIRIEGTMGDSPCSVLAHQSTVQLLCHAEEVAEDKPKREIGFIWNDKKISV